MAGVTGHGNNDERDWDRSLGTYTFPEGRYQITLRHDGPATVVLWQYQQDDNHAGEIAENVGSIVGGFTGGFAGGYLVDQTVGELAGKTFGRAGAWLGRQIGNLLNFNEPVGYTVLDTEGSGTSKVNLRFIWDESEYTDAELCTWAGECCLGIHTDENHTWEIHMERRHIWPWILLWVATATVIFVGPIMVLYLTGQIPSD